MNYNRQLTLVAIALLGLTNSFAQPIITKHPAGQSASLGADVTFKVTATGTAPISYGWRLGEADIPTATASTLTITNVSLAHAGLYTVVVTNSSGSAMSNPAILDVDPSFTKITAGDVVTRTAPGWGAAWGDFDNDGFIDLAVANAGADFLYRNNGDGHFTSITSSPVSEEDFDGGGSVAFADYDNDGHLDLIAGGYDVLNKLFHNQGDGTFTKFEGIVSEYKDTDSAYWGDYNNDGYVDLMIARFGPPNLLFRNNGAGDFSEMTSDDIGDPHMLTSRGLSAAGIWGDYDNDGDLDMFVPRTDARCWFYRNEGMGKFAKTLDLDAPSSNANGAAWGDYDNDGDLDLFVVEGGNQLTANDSLFRNEGGGVFTEMTSEMVGPLVSDRQPGAGCAWADYDNDGWLDLYVANPGLTHNGAETGRTNLFYHNEGDGRFTTITTGSLVNDVASSSSGIWGDYDNDGFMDLFVANGGLLGAQTNCLYRNNGNSNAWLKVKLIGTLANRSAIGAKVRVKATLQGKTLWQLREISGGDGFLSQNDPRPNFGLSNATNAEIIRIEWPSGTVQELFNVAANQIITITEPPRLESTVTVTDGVVELRVKSWPGFVYGIQGTSDLLNWILLGQVTNTTGVLRTSDSEAGRSERFYRLTVP